MLHRPWWSWVGLALVFGIGGCGGSSGSFNPQPQPTIPTSPPVDVNFVFTANAASSNNLSLMSVNNDSNGALTAPTMVTLTNNGNSFTPVGAVLASDAQAIFVAGNGGVMAVPIDPAAGAVTSTTLQAVPTASGLTPTGPMAVDPSGQYLLVATTGGIDAYTLSSDVPTAVTSGQGSFGGTVGALAATDVSGVDVLVEGDTTAVFNTFVIGSHAGLTLSTDAAGHGLAAASAVTALATTGAFFTPGTFGVAGETSTGTSNVQTFTLGVDGSSQPILTVGSTAGAAGQAGAGAVRAVSLSDANSSVTAYCTTNDVSNNVSVFPVSNSNAIAATPSQTVSTPASAGTLAASVLLPAVQDAEAPQATGNQTVVLYVGDAAGEITPFQIGSGGHLTIGTAVSLGVDPVSVLGTSTEVTGI